MSCTPLVYLNMDISFSIRTHDPDTGVVSSADAVPTYRVYVHGSDTPVLTGVMIARDALSVVGFYTKKIAATVANGFAADTVYTVAIDATVDGDPGGISYDFVVLTPIWSVATRTLTQSAAAVAAAVSGSDISILRGDSLSISLTGLGDISARTKLWFTVKLDTEDADAAAIIQIEETAGLLYLNGAVAATPANGDITVSDEVTGAITVTLDEIETAKLVVRSVLVYDVQMLTATDVDTLTSGAAAVTADVTRVIT